MLERSVPMPGPESEDQDKNRLIDHTLMVRGARACYVTKNFEFE